MELLKVGGVIQMMEYSGRFTRRDDELSYRWMNVTQSTGTESINKTPSGSTEGQISGLNSEIKLTRFRGIS